MPQRPDRLSVPVVALLLVLSLVAACGAGFTRGEGLGGSLPVAAANVHGTTTTGGPHGTDRAPAFVPSSSTPAGPTATDVERPDPQPEPEPEPGPGHATFVAAGRPASPERGTVRAAAVERDVRSGHGSNPPARGPPAVAGT
ncbi:hypothetical protein [Streptomyces sp. SID3343]|uniref:hypothetical protein n=1 Tax=Streptomyces sp. SID3343 TaxID=2690260 RepID=UPI0013681A95|nr:hypothetical protein [Streptomyces sp. SID3343]MYV98544.1 hypothetical protein [Streptomyces sp. SID3343]